MPEEISVVVPAYNEESRIEQTLREIVTCFRARKSVFEVIVVNDGSRDGTRACVDRVMRESGEVRVLDRGHNLGKGKSVAEGIEAARYPLVLFIDADNSTRIHEWEKAAEAFAKGADAVIGSRHLPASRIVHPQPLLRVVMGSFYRMLCKLLFGLNHTDLNCGFKAFRTQKAKQIFAQIRMTDWTFDVEVLCRLKRDGQRVSEIPVTWEHCEKISGIRPVGVAGKVFLSLWKLKRSL